MHVLHSEKEKEKKGVRQLYVKATPYFSFPNISFSVDTYFSYTPYQLPITSDKPLKLRSFLSSPPFFAPYSFGFFFLSQMLFIIFTLICCFCLASLLVASSLPFGRGESLCSVEPFRFSWVVSQVCSCLLSLITVVRFL